ADRGGAPDVVHVEALPVAAEGAVRTRVRAEVDRLAARGEHQVEQLGAEVAGRDEARPAEPPPERPERRTDALRPAARRVEDAVDDEELVDAVLVEQRLDLRRDRLGLARPHAASLDDGVGAERALVVAAALRLQVPHAARSEE